MGGIVGDTTEEGNATALLYDVYNKGQVGDETFTYYARHVGGIVGRLSGTVEKAYNTGAIYNGSNVVGGIAGWMYEGSITNAFNTGNITVSNHNSATSQVGGIVGAANLYAGDIVLQNVYNLGTLRSFTNRGSGENSIGGIIGEIFIYGTTWNPGDLKITNAYTLGNIYSNTNYTNVHPMLGQNSTNRSGNVSRINTYYIQPEITSVFNTLTEDGVTSIAYNDRHDLSKWNFSTTGAADKGFSSQDGGTVTIEDGEDWRIYDGVSLPILNAFLPNAEKYFSGETGVTNAMDDISSIQYGTAYDPLLTIINAKTDRDSLTFNWKDLGISNAAGLAVYGANLTLNDFMTTGGSGYFGGLIYSDGALSINAHTSEGNTEVTGDVALGSASQLYGSSVSISADGNVTIYGNITATGNTQDGTTRKEGQYSSQDYLKTNGSISVTGGSVDVYGQLTSAKEGEMTRVPGINSMADGWTPENVGSSTTAMPDLGGRFGYTTGASAATGSISIKATASEDGHVNVYYGHQQKGFLDTAGNLTVEASGDVYMDSDLSIGGNLSITSPGEMILDISNIGKVQKANGTVPNSLTGLHTFLHHFDNTGGTGKGTISFTGTKGTAADAKITVDMWDDEKNEFNLTQYDSGSHKLVDELNALNFSVSGDTGAAAKDYTYIWVSTGEQLAGIQQADSSFLGYNFALKNDIDANMVENYEAIGTGSAFTGTFDGRDNRIIGLNVQGGNAGIFDTIGEGGKVEDLRVYSGTFSGVNNAGAVAGINNGTISNVTTFGNVVTAKGSAPITPEDATSSTQLDGQYVGAAGGIAGVNVGSIDNASVSDAVTADDANAVDKNGNAILSAAGGIAGINQNKISNSSSNSAVNASAGSTYALGGVAGVNEGTLSNVDSLGVTTGIYKGTSTRYSDNVGGIAGRNSGTVSEAYNESIVSGRDNVGGILGKNTGKNVENVSNAARVTGEAASDDTSDYVGGLVGSNSGSITNGRNNGEITGNQYVGGLVGENGKNSTLSNLVNDEAASITGDKYVGGIAGRNYGTISANDKGLVNRGSITGQMYVGGVAGSNEADGIIENTISSIALHVKTPATNNPEDPGNPKYFGGVVGQNSGTINGATNESSVDVAADGATMAGGIIGQNTSTGRLEGTIANEGFVSGKSDVGGIIGSNQNDSILNNTSGNRLVVSNSGQVQAEDGGAAGIFYENTGAIHNADLINTGMVIGGSKEDSITGGLFGTNSGTITNSTLTNNGTVYGGGTVGGLIGENTGDISTSSLINSVNGKVTGLNNVGGLIGQNYGTITGGRDEKDGYYKYQIYNNGTITVGMWNDSDKDGKIADGEIKTDSVNGSNIGGLVGLNGYDENTGKTGSITAGYNTGAIDAAYSENVGGIAGTNTGTLDQVFNTVMTADGQNQTITGGTNVGGIVGSNETGGTVSNAYNTTGVSGKTENAVVGAIAGTNSGTISNVYGTDSGKLVDSDKLVGDETKADHVYQNSTAGFGEGGSSIDKTGEASASTVPWRQYGDNNPLLKVFLTTVNYVESENNQNLVYNGKEQTLNVTGSGFTAEDGFAAHNNVSGGLIYHDVVDVDGGHKNAGTYKDKLWSEQIKAGSTDGTFNPNNLGYDVQSVDYTIDRATLDVTLSDIYRQYGNSNMYTDADRTSTSLNNDYKGYWTISVGNRDDFDQDVLKNDLAQISSMITDGGAADGTNGRVTADAGKHDWSVKVDISAISKNYQLEGDTSGSGVHTYVGDEKSHVAKADLTINLGTVNRTYGDTKLTNGTNYGISTTSELVNGDSGLSLSDDAVIDAVNHDGALVTSGDEVRTNDADDYTWTVDNSKSSFSGVDNLFSNYNVTIVAGKSTVAKRKLSVSDVTASIMYGNQDGKGFTVTGGTLGGVNGETGIVYDDDVSLNTDIKNIEDVENHLVENSTYAENKGDRTTADVNTYEDNLKYTGLTLTGAAAENYELTTDSVTGDIEVTQAKLTINLDTVNRTYGDTAFTNGTDYGITASGLVNGDSGLSLSQGATITDEALVENGDKTNNAGDNYTWTVTNSESSFSGVDNLFQNYDVKIEAGKSTVAKRKLSVSDVTASIMYGNQDGKGFTVTGGTLEGVDGKAGIVYDDDVSLNTNIADIENHLVEGADTYKENKGDRTTADAGIYTDSLSYSGLGLAGEDAGNYELTTDSVTGDIKVTQAAITVSADSHQIYVGAPEPTYTGTKIEDLLVNGDSLNGTSYEYGPQGPVDTNQSGETEIGIHFGDTYFGSGSGTDWSGAWDGFKNYSITFTPGTLTVEGMPSDMPEISDGEKWNSLLRDTPWDRNGNFRERKAEIHFIAGGMSY